MNLDVNVAAFKAARLFSPFKVNEIQPTAKDVDDLMAFPFLVDEIDHLKAELPAYLALAADVNADVNILEWWKNHSSPGSDSCLPHWSSAVQKVLLVQPSSATAERVFSMLNQSFGEQQQNALEDLVETTIMLQCNKR
ncbi:DNA-directed primase polymerase [Paramuricea clavata]|uniref:DNA-directed primase polymerase n=1 Tax=Paramuricea clavata TaxID=317549 RepID=A0A7D9HA11_PARCT|nr:DNA-directed primase polymerase [Paramuricea clavata]